MNKQIKQFSEDAADVYASKFLNKYFGGEVFLGSDIEQLLAEKAYVVYQNVDDLAYFGAAVHLAGHHIIAINTKQKLRTRYYSAAHELWHLLFESGEVPVEENSIDQERAADHFAAAVMLPETLILNLAKAYSEDKEKLVFKIADISSMPYEAVTRRLVELGQKISKPLIKRTELEWINSRKEIGLAPSALDKEDVFVQFDALSKEVERKVKKQEITLEIAANLLKHIDPSQAERYWQARQQLEDDWDFDED